MNLKEQLVADLQDAMRSGDELRKSTIRMARAAIKNAEMAKIAELYEANLEAGVQEGSGSDIKSLELDDAGVADVLRKEIKQRRESAEMYDGGKRPELAQKERAEAAILEAYLPKQMSYDEIEVEVRALVDELGLSGAGRQAMSKVMPAAMSRLKGRAEVRLVSSAVSDVLTEGAD